MTSKLPLRGVFGLLLGFALGLAGCAGSPRQDIAGGHDLPGLDAQRAQVVRTARAMLDRPYRYGGESPDRGFDCSGLVYYSHAQAGLAVPRTSVQQRRRAVRVDPEQLRPGDLVFFRTWNKGGHVGIYVGGGGFIHAPSSGGRVRTDSLHQPYWRRNLAGAGHLFPTT